MSFFVSNKLGLLVRISFNSLNVVCGGIAGYSTRDNFFLFLILFLLTVHN